MDQYAICFNVNFKFLNLILEAIYDPGSFYGHHEYDLGIAGLFGMASAFFNEYHKKLPKEPGFEERHDLYKLFHLLNHWYDLIKHNNDTMHI